MYSVYVRNNMSSLGFASQYGEKCILDFTFVSQYRDDLSEPYKPTGELGLCTIMMKNSKFVDFTVVKQMEVLLMYPQAGYCRVVDKWKQ